MQCRNMTSCSTDRSRDRVLWSVCLFVYERERALTQLAAFVDVVQCFCYAFATFTRVDLSILTVHREIDRDSEFETEV